MQNEVVMNVGKSETFSIRQTSPGSVLPTLGLGKLFHDNEIRVLDEKEYLHHKKSYQYSDELDAVLKNQTQLIVEKMKKREFPFDDQLINDYFNKYLESTKKE